MDVMNTHAPIKKKLLKHRQAPYMNSNLRRAINVRNMLKRKFDVCNSKENWIKYKNQRNLVNKLRKQSIRNHVQASCNEDCNQKQFWNTVKPLMSDKSNMLNNDIILKDEETIINSKSEVCSVMNSYFVNVAKIAPGKPYTGIQHDCDISVMIDEYCNHESVQFIKKLNSNDSTFDFMSVTTNDVRDVLLSMNPKKSTGHDNIPPRLLKLGADVLCYPIQSIINVCIQRSVFPDTLKLAEVTPVFKKGDTLLVSNYRPISILTCISKIFEKCIYKRKFCLERIRRKYYKFCKVIVWRCILDFE